METQNKQGYKQTEVGLIPEEWEVITLSEVFDFKNGLNKEKKFFGSGTPIVNYMDVYKRNGIKGVDLAGRVTLTGQEIRNFEVRKGDVFFTRTSETIEEIGVAAVLLEDVTDTVFSGFVLRARPKNERLNLEFRKYCFASSFVRKEITSKSSYTTRALTNGRLLSEVKLPLPPLPEQTAIASALSDMDALIAQTEKLIEKKKAIKQGVMQELLTGKKRLKGFENSKGYKQTEVGVIPEHWEVKFIKQVAPLQRGFDLPTKDIKTGPFPVVYSNGIVNYHNDFKVKKPGVVTGRSGTIGKITFVEKDYWPHNTSLWVTNFFENDPKFVFYLFNNLRIERFASGSGVPTLNRNDVHDFKIPLPPLPEQTAIASALSDMDEDIRTRETKLQKLKLQKQGMMQALLTGKIRLV